MQRSDIGTATREHLGQLGVNYVTGTVLYGAINRAARRLNSETTMNRGDVQLRLSTGVYEKTMSGTALDIYSVRLGTGTTRVKLEPTSRAALDRDEGDWEAGTAGTPTHYWIDGMKFGVYPKPIAAATAYMRCLQSVTTMSNATAVPSWCPNRYHDTIAKLAAVDIAQGYSAGDTNSVPRLSQLYQEYLREANELRSLAGGRSRERVSKITPAGYTTFRK